MPVFWKESFEGFQQLRFPFGIFYKIFYALIKVLEMCKHCDTCAWMCAATFLKPCNTRVGVENHCGHNTTWFP